MENESPDSLGLIQDLPQPERTLAELQESEARFRAIFEKSSVGIALVSLDSHPLAVNQAIVRMTGFSEPELLAMTGLDLSHPDDRNKSSEMMRPLVEGKLDFFQIECRFIHKDGHEYWVRQRISSIRGPDGAPAYLVVMVADIDEQHHMLMELQASEARFRAMFDNLAIGMALVSFDRRVLAANQTLEQISGYSAEELSHINITDLAYPEDREIGAHRFREIVAGQSENMQLERRYIRKNGEVFWARICYSLVRNQANEPQYLVGSMEDITDRKLAADKLAEQEAEYRRTLEQRVDERTHELTETNLRLVQEIEQRQLAEDELARKAVEDAITAERTRLARDLHDAVTQTLFSASLIAEVLPELWQMDVAEAQKSTEELRQLTRGALAEMRTLLLELRPAALTQARFSDLLKQLSEAVIGRARLPVTLSVQGEYDLPPDVKVAFYRIAQESLNNVVKYARATQVEIRIRLDCCNVHLAIIDNGIGFDASTVKPTSLGMRIMRERAESIHAHFNISSTPGQGTTVSVAWNEDEIIPITEILVRGKR